MTDPTMAAYALAFLMATELAGELLKDPKTPASAREALTSLRRVGAELGATYSAAAGRDVMTAQSKAELYCGMMNIHTAGVPPLKTRLDQMAIAAERMYLGER